MNEERIVGSWRIAAARAVARVALLAAAVPLAFVGACGEEGPVGTPGESVGRAAPAALTANVTGEIQIDNGSTGADLYDNQGTPQNAGALLDWVKDNAGNGPPMGTPPGGCLTAEGEAVCNEIGATAAAEAGNWNGARIVDGIAGNDQNIFLTGGKENEFETWNVGPGSVGSSKYDITQALLANNPTTLYFGMERRGNNGTTFFDFEFNQAAPDTCATPADVPCRTDGDVLFGFEMQGAGNSGSATPFFFIWDDSAGVFVEQDTSVPPYNALIASINSVQTTDGPPWGHVDSKGDWVLGDLDRFQFAEAAAPLSLLPGVNACGGQAWVQVRTRSSSTANSDLKDTTRIFNFVFGTLTAQATLAGSCDGSLELSASAVGPDGIPIPVGDLTCNWTIDLPGGGTSTTSGCDLTGTNALTGLAAGSYSASVEVTATGIPGCVGEDDSNTVTVYVPIEVYITPDNESLMCPPIDGLGDDVTYTATVSGGDGSYSFNWTGCTPGGTGMENQCTVDPSDSDFCNDTSVFVMVDDGAAQCPPVQSETELYQKRTTVTSTDNSPDAGVPDAGVPDAGVPDAGL